MGCCAYKENAIPKPSSLTKQPKLPLKCCNLVPLEKITGNKCQCLYQCGGMQSIQYLHPNSLLSIHSFELLFERGFVRNAHYFRKYDSTQCCCIGYNMRINVKQNSPTQKQIRIINSFFDVIMQLSLGIYQVLPLKIKPLDKKLQKVMIQQKTVSLKEKVVNQQFNQEMQEILIEIDQCLKACQIGDKSQQIQCNNLSLIIKEADKIRIFHNNDSFYSNHNLLLYHQNNSILNSQNQKFSQEEFNLLLGEFLNNKNICNQKFLLSQKKTGYLTIKRQDKLTNKIKAQKKKTNQIISIQQEKQHIVIPETVKQSLIDESTFTFENFSVGSMNISIKQPESTSEIVELYLLYMQQIHKEESTDSSFIQFYTPCVLEQNQYLVDAKQNRRLQLGQRFMEYRINNILIGVGVIILTTKYLISEYLFYDPRLKKESFGIFAGFVEINYVKLVQNIFPEFQYSSLCYIISTNQAMNYKMQFNGLEIQCNKTFLWVKYNKEIKKLMKQNIAQLIESSDEGLKEIDSIDIRQCQLQQNGEMIKFQQLDRNGQIEVKQELKANAQVLGKDLMMELVFKI